MCATACTPSIVASLLRASLPPPAPPRPSGLPIGRRSPVCRESGSAVVPKTSRRLGPQHLLAPHCTGRAANPARPGCERLCRQIRVPIAESTSGHQPHCAAAAGPPPARRPAADDPRLVRHAAAAVRAAGSPPGSEPPGRQACGVGRQAGGPTRAGAARPARPARPAAEERQREGTVQRRREPRVGAGRSGVRGVGPAGGRSGLDVEPHLLRGRRASVLTAEAGAF